jgi:hypothetical protein
MPTYPARQCPACEFWFLPLSHNTVACSVKCANRIKALQRKSRSTTYIRSPTVQPSRPVPETVREEAFSQLGMKSPTENVQQSAESVLASLGYSSRSRGEPSPEAQPPTGGAVPSVPPAPVDRRELACGHRDIGVHPCPLCHPPVLETDNA